LAKNLPQRAVITGATSGIGRATAELFARHGIEVGVLAEIPAHLKETVETIRRAGGRAFPVHADLSDPEQVEGVIPRIEREFGPVDLLVNNAGLGLQADVPEATDADLRLLFEINYFAAFFLSRDAFRLMSERGRGQIINVSSASARRALPGLSVYASSKAAMHAFSQALRIEARRKGVFVTEILPMSVKTPFFKNARNRSKRPYAVGSFSITPERLAERILWAVRHPVPELYSSSLSRFVLGLDGMFPKILDRVLAGSRARPLK
jgi:short-subunit dehydrogenase